MGFVLIRHSADELRSGNMDRAPKVLGVRENVGKIGEVSEREFVLVVSVRCGPFLHQVMYECFW